MEMFRRTLLIAVAALTLVSLMADLIYARRPFRRRAGYWFERGKKAVGLS